MHLPDGFLNNQMSVGLIAVAIGFLAVSFKQLKKSLFEKVTVIKSQLVLADGPTTESSASQKSVLSQKGLEKIRLMAVISSLIFAMQMINFPVINGTSGHLIGGVLAAIVLGPWAGLLVISIVLIVQSLVFADGGLLALGANIINMGLVASVAGYFIYRLSIKSIKCFRHEPKAIGLWPKGGLASGGKPVKPWRFLIIGITAWLTVVLASFFCAVEIGWSGTIDFALVISAMVKIHLLIGIGEALLTVLIIKALKLKLYYERHF